MFGREFRRTLFVPLHMPSEAGPAPCARVSWHLSCSCCGSYTSGSATILTPRILIDCDEDSKDSTVREAAALTAPESILPDNKSQIGGVRRPGAIFRHQVSLAPKSSDERVYTPSHWGRQTEPVTEIAQMRAMTGGTLAAGMILLSAGAAPLRGQAGSSAQIADAGGAFVPNATVTARHACTGLVRTNPDRRHPADSAIRAKEDC